jgi:hypothetical protein
METALNFLVQETKRGGRSVFFIRVVSLVDDEVVIGTLIAYVAENACPKVPLTAGSDLLLGPSSGEAIALLQNEVLCGSADKSLKPC